MKLRIFNLIAVVMAFVATATAQSLSVAPIEAAPGAQTEITVSLKDATEMTALQCNLHLPEGLALAESTGNYGITLGDAANGHTLSVSPLTSGDLLIVLYSMYQTPFADGTLLTIPVVVAEEAGTTEGSLHTVRTATADAVSKALSDAKFSASLPNGIDFPIINSKLSTIYDLAGRRVTSTDNLKAGIYIVNGRKVVAGD